MIIYSKERYETNLRDWVWRTIIIVAWLIIWQETAQILIEIKPINRILISTPLQVGHALFEFITGTAPSPVGDINNQLLVTLYQIALAFIIAAATGLGAGMLVGSFRFIGESLEPIIVALLAVPNFVLLPIFWLVFGLALPRQSHSELCSASFQLLQTLLLVLGKLKPSTLL